MSGYRESRRAIEYHARVLAEGQEVPVWIGNVSPDGMRIDGLKDTLDAFRVKIDVGVTVLDGIIIWQAGGRAGVRLANKLPPALLARLRHETRKPTDKKKRFLIR